MSKNIYSCFFLLSICLSPFSLFLSVVTFSIACLTYGKTVSYVSYIYLIYIVPLIMVSRGVYVSKKDDMLIYFHNFDLMYHGIDNAFFFFNNEVGLPIVNKIILFLGGGVEFPLFLAYIYALLQVILLIFIFHRYSYGMSDKDKTRLLIFCILFIGWITFTHIVRQSFSTIFIIWFFLEKKRILKFILFIISILFHSTALIIIPLLMIIQTMSKKGIKEIIIISLVIVFSSLSIKFIYINFIVNYAPLIVKIKLNSFMYRDFIFDYIALISFFHKIIFSILISFLFSFKKAINDQIIKSAIIILIFGSALEIIAYNSSERIFIIIISFLSGYYIYYASKFIRNDLIKLMYYIFVPIIYFSSKVIFSDNSNPFTIFYLDSILNLEPFYYINNIFTNFIVGWR